MRTVDADTARIVAGRSQSVWVRLWFTDHLGTWRDVTTLYGRDWLDSVTREEDLELGWAKLDVGIKRNIDHDSLSPQMTGVRANTGSPLLALGRKVRLEAQLQPAGVPADPSRWVNLYEGYVEHIDPSGESIKVESRDLGSLLDRTELTVERDYGVWMPGRRYLAGTVVVPQTSDPNDSTNTVYMQAQNTAANWGSTWQPSHVYLAGSKVIPSKPNGYCYTASGGTSGSVEPAWPEPTLPGGAGATVTDHTVTWTESTASCTEPTWPAKGSGGTVVDGGITWKEQGIQGTPMETLLQQLLDDNLGPSVVVLNTPTSPSDFRRDYKQAKTTLYAAMKAIVDIIGWDLRYAWDSGSSTWKLTFMAPGGALGRTSPTVVDTISADDYKEVRELSDDISLYRNQVKVAYSDRTDPDDDGNPTPKVEFVQNATSVAKLGPLFSELQLAATDAINSPTEANTLATNVLADLSNQLLTSVIETPLRWWYELNDYITLNGDGRVFDSDLSGAVTVKRDVFEPGGVAHTELTMRAKPSTGQLHWLKLAATPNAGVEGNKKVGPRSPINTSISQVVGGIAVDWKPPIDSATDYHRTELHVSQTMGFTPGPTTLVKSVGGHRVEHTDGLTPGVTQYARIRHVDRKGNKGQYSPEQTIAAGQAQLIHLHPSIRRMVYAIVDSDVANNTGGLTVPYKVGAHVLPNIQGYDTAPLPTWDDTGHFWQPDTPGKYAVRAQIEVDGVAAGDSIIMGLFNSNFLAYAAYSPTMPAVPDPWGGTRMSVNWVQTIDVTSGDIAAGAQFSFVAKFGPFPYSTNVTVKGVPGGGLSWTSTVRFSGSYVEISQILAP